MSLLRARDDECLSPGRLLECQGQPAPVYSRRPGVQRNFRARERARARFTTSRRDDLNRHTLTVRERSTVCDERAQCGAQCSACTSTPRLPHSYSSSSSTSSSSSSYTAAAALSVSPSFSFCRSRDETDETHGRTKNARSHVGCTSH